MYGGTILEVVRATHVGARKLGAVAHDREEKQDAVCDWVALHADADV